MLFQKPTVHKTFKDTDYKLLQRCKGMDKKIDRRLMAYMEQEITHCKGQVHTESISGALHSISILFCAVFGFLFLLYIDILGSEVSEIYKLNV